MSRPAPARDQASRLRSLVQALSSRAEASRRGPPVVAISSGKGGVGKTTLSVNLAVAMASRRRTLLIDADLGMANADIFCGLSPTRRLGSARFEDLIVEAPGGFQLVPGAVGRRHPDGEGVVGSLDLVTTHEMILIDTSPGVGRDVRRLIGASDLAVIVATPEPTSIADAYALLKCLHAERVMASDGRTSGTMGELGLVVSQVSSRREADRIHARINGVATRFLGWEVPMLGWIPFDMAVRRSILKRAPFLVEQRRGRTASCLREIASTIESRVGVASG